MKKHIPSILLSIILLTAIGYVACFYRYPLVSSSQLASTVPQELTNKVFHWHFTIGWDFKVLITEQGIFWQRMDDKAQGESAHVSAQFSKVRHGIYLLSWIESPVNTHSLVVNFVTNEIQGHSKINNKLIAVTGRIDCNGIIQICSPPIN